MGITGCLEGQTGDAPGGLQDGNSQVSHIQCQHCPKRGKRGNGIRTYTYKGQNIDLCYECAEKVESVWPRADETSLIKSNGAEV